MMFNGICPDCDYQFIGSELLDPQHQSCPHCGIGRLVINDSFRPLEGYFTSTAGRPDINQADGPLAKEVRIIDGYKGNPNDKKCLL
jgi:hypothetical protein